MKKQFHDSTLQEYAPGEAETVIPKIESTTDYEYKETSELVQLVKEAADLIHVKGEGAFSDFRIPGSRWRQGETYIFVLDPKGNMLVHPEAELEGKNQLNLKDINGKHIVRGLLGAATALTGKPHGWYHYEWNDPGGLLPRWKSSYVELAKSPSDKTYIVGSGMYNDRMEREFVVDMVKNAVAEIEKKGKAAFELFRDATGPFRVKDSYIFVMDTRGVELCNPVFTNLEGRNLLDLKDTQGKFVDRELIQVQKRGSGWVDHMWPKPGESASTQVSTYVSAASLNGTPVVVGSSVYLADAPKAVSTTKKMSAPELMTLVREAADILKEKGEKAYPEFRKKGSRWFSGHTYLFVFTMDGTRAFHAAEPDSEGRNDSDLKDILGKPIFKMFFDATATSAGEGWVHYMWPQPGDIFPAWKSSFVKSVIFPNGKQYIVGCGIYNMQMDKVFIEDVVNRAAALVEQSGMEAFTQLRDKKGPFVFMDTYIFLDNPKGVELVNAAQPSMEGKNIIDLKDTHGKLVARECIDAATKNGNAWVDYYWYKPRENEPAHKCTYVKKVQSDGQTYIVGSGYYVNDKEAKKSDVQKISWETLTKEKLSDSLSRQTFFGEKGTLARFFAKTGAIMTQHSHINEEYLLVISGKLKYNFDGRDVLVSAGEALVVPPNLPHSIVVPEEAVFFVFFAPQREDWLRGEDKYLRR